MKGKKLDEDICQQIINLWMNYNYNQQKIADTLGVGYSTVRRIIAEYAQDGSHTPPAGMLPPAEKPERKSQINEEFDNAVNQMIEESKPQEIVQTDKPVIMTEEHTATVPDAVIEAVREQLASHELYVESNLSSIRELQQENEQYRTKIAALKKWLAEVTA